MPGQLAHHQRELSHRRQRKPVEEAGLDVVGHVGARAVRREQRSLHEGDGEREVEVRVGRETGRSVAESSPLELIDSRISGKTIAGTTIAGWRSVRTTERRASMPTWR